MDTELDKKQSNVQGADQFSHEDYRGEFINSFIFCQPITDVYRGQLTNESA